MAINNLLTLKTAAADFLQRGDLSAVLQTCVELATARLSDRLRTPEMESLATTTVTSEWTALPVDFREARLFEAQGKVLEYRTPWQLQKLVEHTTKPSVPVYTIQDLQFRVYPFQTGLTVELTYYAALPALSAAADTNWLLLRRPDVYLQQTMYYAYDFLRDDERMARALVFVDKYVEEANRASRRMMVGAAPLSIRAA